MAGGTVREDTSYPFEDEMRFTLVLRIPGWCTEVRCCSIISPCTPRLAR
jgi:DUF1680 family protein